MAPTDVQPLRAKLGRVPSTERVLRALPEGYSTLDEIHAFLAGVEAAYPTLARVLDSRAFAPGVTFEVHSSAAPTPRRAVLLSPRRAPR